MILEYFHSDLCMCQTGWEHDKEWIYTNKVLGTEAGFLREQRDQSDIVQLVDEL